MYRKIIIPASLKSEVRSHPCILDPRSQTLNPESLTQYPQPLNTKHKTQTINPEP